MTGRIVSGGQTGVDRAALDTALEMGIPCGGWCPRGRKAEDGTIPSTYPLQETESRNYNARTKLNLRDSDATLVLTWGELSGGTENTVRLAEKLGKPCFIVFLNAPVDPYLVFEWMMVYNFQVLNIAGSRESKHPGIYDEARWFLRAVLVQAVYLVPDESAGIPPGLYDDKRIIRYGTVRPPGKLVWGCAVYRYGRVSSTAYEMLKPGAPEPSSDRTAYTIMPDYGGAYGWMKQNGKFEGSSQLGPNHACTAGWYGDHPISEKLHNDFARWQTVFETETLAGLKNEHLFDWKAYHAKGFDLAQRLKDELGSHARVFYRKPCEDPSCNRVQEWELMEDGAALERIFRLEGAE